ncbi:Elongation of fatty acids protein 2 [Entomortierella chlamydospora]|uniref:Elongation of fatty acids protein 2 n=1 Tax=Entomortierella chlamydospora TaxID=101097 RepID=A0A9P6N2X3_9FUNG|nr:Elongation of fatty acids protein 2 [Entomortierella chlamydospora]KAG0021800.1 Elongation of fatty acids protein 2 [Entomortierella chlamydospora]
MGVKGLTALLQRLAPESVRTQHISHYKDKTLAVDVSCFLNRFNPHPARVQRGVYRLCTYLRLNGIKPIFVFDGPVRIIEKQREAERRAAVKEKIEKSFQLEKTRKSRLKELKGSSKLLQSFPPERAASILEGIQLQSGNPVLTTTQVTSAKSTGDSETSTSLNLSEKSGKEVLHPIQKLFPLEDLSLDEDGLESEPLWHIPEVSEDEQRQLDVQSRDIKDLYADNGSLPLVDFGYDEDIESSKHDIYTLEHSELDIETVRDLDLIRDLSDDVDATSRDDGLPLVLRTGTSIQNVIPADELAQIYKANPLDPANDDQIRQKVHEALLRFVETIEKEYVGDAEESEKHATQRQKELNMLEQKLVEEIKEVARLNSAGLKPREECSFVPVESDAESAVSLLTPPETPAPNFETTSASHFEVTPAPLGSTSPEIQSSPDINTARDLGSEQISSPTKSRRRKKRVDKEASSRENEQGNERSESVLVDTVTEEQDAQPIEAINPTQDIHATNHDTDIVTEAKQDRDLQSMIKDVLSTHQTLFVTLERRTLSITRPLTLSCQMLLKAMGQPVVEAQDAEAESVCARLATLGIVDASVSEDTDTAVFGNGILLRQVDNSKNKDIIEIDPLVAQKSLGLSRDAFRDLCILCGTDFSGTIEGIGPFKAAKLIQRYGSIESVMANISNQPRPDFFYDQARRVFDSVPEVPQCPDAYQPKPEIQPLLQDLISKYEIDPEEVEREIRREMGFEKILSTESRDVFGGSAAFNDMGPDPFKALVIDIPEMRSEIDLDINKM